MEVGATPEKGSLHSYCSGKTWAMPSRTRFSSGQKSQPLQGGRVGVRGFLISGASTVDARAWRD